MTIRHAEPIDRRAFEIELDDDHRLAADDPAVVSGIDGDDLGRLVFDDTAVAVLDVYFSTHEESDVGVHAEVRADDGFHVDRPPEADRVDHPLYARRAGPSHFDLNVADVAELSAFHPRGQRIEERRSSGHRTSALHRAPRRLGLRCNWLSRTRPLRDGLLLGHGVPPGNEWPMLARQDGREWRPIDAPFAAGPPFQLRSPRVSDK